MGKSHKNIYNNSVINNSSGAEKVGRRDYHPIIISEWLSFISLAKVSGQEALKNCVNRQLWNDNKKLYPILPFRAIYVRVEVVGAPSAWRIPPAICLYRGQASDQHPSMGVQGLLLWSCGVYNGYWQVASKPIWFSPAVASGPAIWSQTWLLEAFKDGAECGTVVPDGFAPSHSLQKTHWKMHRNWTRSHSPGVAPARRCRHRRTWLSYPSNLRWDLLQATPFTGAD